MRPKSHSRESTPSSGMEDTLRRSSVDGLVLLASRSSASSVSELSESAITPSWSTSANPPMAKAPPAPWGAGNLDWSWDKQCHNIDHSTVWIHPSLVRLLFWFFSLLLCFQASHQIAASWLWAAHPACKHHCSESCNWNSDTISSYTGLIPRLLFLAFSMGGK